MAGIGGHGGFGRNADIKKKYQEIVLKIKQHISPVTPKHVLKSNTSYAGKAPSESNSTAPSSASRSHSNPSSGHDNGDDGNDARITPQVAVTKCAVCTIL